MKTTGRRNPSSPIPKRPANALPPLLGEKGQAAVTDALYFLMVVTFLSIFMFGFANSYGNSIREKIGNEYSTSFATNALKTILYASTPREASKTVYDADAEIDYLLAVIKEDYSDDAVLGPTERKVLGRTVSAVMAPVADTKDYAFYVTIPPQEQTNKQGQFIFLYLHTTNFKVDASAFSSQKVPRYFVMASAGEPSHRDYFCVVPAGQGDVDYSDLVKRLSRLFANIGPTAQASSQVKLVQETGKGSWFDFRAQADLVMWDATWLGATRDRQAGLFYGESNGPAEIDPAWSCEEVM